MTSWDPLARQAKYLESKLESEVLYYSNLAQKLSTWDHSFDRERPYDGGRDENDMSVQIDRNLNDLSDCIQKMKLCHSLNSHQEGLIKRYTDINFEYRQEYKNISQTIQRKKESLELFGSSSSSYSNSSSNSSSNSMNPRSNSSGGASGVGAGGDDGLSAATSKLLRERSTQSMIGKGVGDMIQQAITVKDSLTSQRLALTSTGGGLSTITSAAPSFSRLIDSMQKKKFRDNVIMAVVLGVLSFFTIWWVFLR